MSDDRCDIVNCRNNGIIPTTQLPWHIYVQQLPPAETPTTGPTVACEDCATIVRAGLNCPHSEESFQVRMERRAEGLRKGLSGYDQACQSELCEKCFGALPLPKATKDLARGR